MNQEVLQNLQKIYKDLNVHGNLTQRISYDCGEWRYIISDLTSIVLLHVIDMPLVFNTTITTFEGNHCIDDFINEYRKKTVYKLYEKHFLDSLELIENTVKFNDKSKIKHFGMRFFIREFNTMTFTYPRQVGTTTLICNHAKEDDLIVCRNDAAVSQYNNSSCKRVTSVKEFIKPSNGLLFCNPYKTVWLDCVDQRIIHKIISKLVDFECIDENTIIFGNTWEFA